VHIDLWTPEFMLVFWLTVFGATATGRVLMRLALRNARLHGRNLRDMIIVGTNPRAVQFAKKMRDNPFLGYRIVGFDVQDSTRLVDYALSGLCMSFYF